MATAIESLLGLKRWKEDEAKSNFAMALKELAVEEDVLKGLEDELIKIDNIFNGISEKGSDIEGIKRTLEYQDFVVKQISLQKEVILKKEAVAEAARKALVDATRDKKIFEKLHEKQLNEEAKRQLRLEQIQTDESSSIRYKSPEE